jgi:biotin carboxyl carrier protein
MPQKIFMNIENPQVISARQQASYNYYLQQQQQQIQKQQQQQQQQQNTSNKGYKIDLASPMIGRVYTAKPGCSSCGK